MSKPEILAPAGGQAQLLAAVRAGADGVYLGAKGFNARQNAENFESLGAAVSYCHGRDVSVYVTLNTLVMDGELERLLDTIREIADSGADAVIVQDLGAARLLRDCCPRLPLHASTQMAVHNAAGARAAMALGFSRVVAARELEIGEIRALADTGVEVETFVHGAHCMSVSGCCYLSAMLGGRSGNRGRCAQPCRLDFRAAERPFALSLKDMCYIERLGALRDAGVCSFKIEGRMKRPEYVAAAVSACRASLNGEKPDLESLRAVFSRSGFTDGYLTGRRDLSMFGNRTREDVNAAAGVLGGLEALYRAERQSVPVDMSLELAEEAPARLSLQSGAEAVTVRGPIPERAHKRPLDEGLARRSLEKTGGTPFLLRGLTYHREGEVTLSGASLNAMRREGLQDLLALKSQIKPYAMEAKLPALPERKRGQGRPALRGRYARFVQAEGSPFAQVILPLGEIEAAGEAALARFGSGLIAELPALIFPGEEESCLSRLRALGAMGLETALAENIGALRIAREAGLRAEGGHGLNILNSVSLMEYGALGLSAATASFELQLKRALALQSAMPLGIIGYGYLPLMLFRACPMQGEKGCSGCGGKARLVDRRGVEFPVLCHKRSYSTLLNSLPLYLADKGIEGFDFMTLYFTLETPEACRDIERAYLEGLPPAGPFTRGLYYRELQ